MDNSVIDLTLSDYSDGEENQSSEFEEEMDEFPYQCKQCPENFKYMAEAQSHFFQYHQSNEKQNGGMMRRHEQTEKNYSCHQQALEMIEKQMGNKLFGKGEFPCLKCKVVLKFKKSWIKHMQNRHKDFSVGEDWPSDNFCKSCNKMFKNRTTFRIHVRIFHEGVTYDCPRCNKTFHQKRGLMTHMTKYPDCANKIKNHRGKKQTRQVQTKVKIQDNQEKNQVQHKCLLCYASFSTRNILDSHIFLVHKPFGFRDEYEPKMDKTSQNYFLNNNSILENNSEQTSFCREEEETEKPKMTLKIKAFATLKEENVINLTNSL